MAAQINAQLPTEAPTFLAYSPTPSVAEKDLIWRMYRGHFGIPDTQARPKDDGWTGAEIRSCCRLAALLDISLHQAAQHVVPVAVTAAEPGFCGKLDLQKPGSLFTSALLRVLKTPHGELVRHLDKDSDSHLQWDELLPQLRGLAAQYDRQQSTGAPQQAYATSLGRWMPLASKVGR